MIFLIKSHWQRIRQKSASILYLPTLRLVPLVHYFLFLIYHQFHIFYKYPESKLFLFSLGHQVLLLFFLSVLFIPKLLYSAWFWGGITAYYWILLIDNWFIVNNHEILAGYWQLLFFASFFIAPQKRAVFLKTHSKLLLGLIFLFSIIHKTISPDFLSGNVLHKLLLSWESYLFLDIFLPFDYVGLVQENLQNMFFSDQQFLPRQLNQGPPILKTIAKFMSLGAYVLELSITIIFLLPKKYAFKHAQHWVLLLFIVSTYFPLRITGFMYILTVMGLAQTQANQRLIRTMYLGVLTVYICFDVLIF